MEMQILWRGIYLAKMSENSHGKGTSYGLMDFNATKVVLPPREKSLSCHLQY